MKSRLLASIAIGVLVTALELILVVSPSEVAAPPPPERSAKAPVVVEAPAPRPPKPNPIPEPTPSRVRHAQRSVTPQPLRAQAHLPRTIAAPVGLSLASALPGLTGEGGALELALSAPQEPDRAAVPQRSPEPRYPADARRRGVEGYVVVRMRVGTTGRVEDAVVVESEPNGVFDRSAMAAALSSRFLPARSQGRPVASTTEQRLRFRLR